MSIYFNVYIELFILNPLRVAGACRCYKLTFLDISHVQDNSSYLYALITDTKTNISRSFAIFEEAFSDNAAEIVSKIHQSATGMTFFLLYMARKYTIQLTSRKFRKPF